MSSNSRQRPLHACGVSILAIADIAFGKTQNMNGPLGSTLRKMANLAKFATPLIYAMQYQWLAILSFIDDRIILTAENITEKLFPPTTHAFDKIDEIVLMIVSLPDKFDGAVNYMFPAIIHQVPFLEWALTRVISRLNSLASTLNHWGQENSSVDEKTIGVVQVDSNCNIEQPAESPRINERMDSFPPIPEAENKGVVHDVAVSSHVKGIGSYKEALLESVKEEKSSTHDNKKMEKKIDGGDADDECEANNVNEGKEKIDGDNEECESIMKCQVERSESSMKDDALLELFESAWLMKPGHY